MSGADYDSDDVNEVEIESDIEEDCVVQVADKSSSNSGNSSPTEKRKHNNFAERKRRDHIKDSFTLLRESVPIIDPEKVPSRAQILKSAAEYIQRMRRKTILSQQDIEKLKKENNRLEAQIKVMVKRRKLNVDDKNVNAGNSKLKTPDLSNSSSDEN